jgi:hypothetical protein
MPGSQLATTQQAFKDTVRAATVGANITLSGTQTLDGVALAVGDRVLVKDQTTVANNGIYWVQSGAWNRCADAWTQVNLQPKHTVYVSEGTINKCTAWAAAITGTIVPGTTNLFYTRTFPAYDDMWNNPWEASWLGSNLSRALIQTSWTSYTSGTVYLSGGMVLRAGLTYSTVNIFYTTAGTAVTHTWAGLANATTTAQWPTVRTLIAVSPDNTAAPTANAFRTFTFGTAITPNEDTPVWIVTCNVATTTVPGVGSNFAVANAGLLAAIGSQPVFAGSSNTGQTTPIAVNTQLNAPTAVANIIYGYLT